MSLLMDALKKAEQEKKEAAKRQQEIEETPEDISVELKPKTLDDTDTWGHDIVDASTTAEIPGLQGTGAHSTTAELELEPITNADDTAEIPNLGAAAASSQAPDDPTLNVTINELSLAELSAEGIEADDADEPAQGPTSIQDLQSENADLDETFHGVSLDTTAVNPELFQETVQGDAFLPDDEASQTWGETLPGIPAAQLARDIGSDDQPTPVAAQTVFAATGTTRAGGIGLKWGLAGLGSIAVIAVIVWYYLTITPMNRAAQSPQIAQGIESVGPPLRETLDLNIRPITGEMDDMEAGDSFAGDLSTDDVLAQESGGSGPLTGQEPGEATAESSTSGVDDEVKSIAASAPVAPDVLADTEDQGPMKIGALPDSIVPEPSLIKISRSKETVDKGKGIRDAYFAYQKGAYGTAEEKYREALKDFPENRDALLGLGAIASNKGDYNVAYDYYARLLTINPRDQFAKAALINLQDRSVLSNSESTVTSMLHDSPDSHFLHFTLGNIYASGSRWAEAQQAFFDAYRLNSANPDYALNLAVSLDHIGQYGAALDYYNAAIELSDNKPSKFDSSPVRQRINDLTRVAGP